MKDIGSRAFLLACLVGLAGCSPSADGYSGPRGSVAGRLTIDGTALRNGCQVVFMATRGRFIASGAVAEDGRYTLLYSVSQGLPVGDYVVQLGLPSDYAASIAGPSGGPAVMDVSAINKAWKAGMPFPERYLAASTSDLRFTVQPGANTADFELTQTAQRDAAGRAP
jgi:type 1 fimbria pilin